MIALCTSCGVLPPSRTYLPIGDLETDVPLHMVEGGYGRPVQPPPGIDWAAVVNAYREDPLESAPTRRYELELELRDTAAVEGEWRLEPRIEDAMLVDDLGQRFFCHRARVPDETDEDRPQKRGRRPFTLIFDLPASYEFRRIRTVTVHWALVIGSSGELRISSRFRT